MDIWLIDTAILDESGRTVKIAFTERGFAWFIKDC